MADLFRDNHNSKNICLQHLNSQTTGRKLRYWKIPSEILLSNRQVHIRTLWTIFRKLDHVYFKTPFDVVSAIDCLQSILRTLDDADIWFNDDSKHEKAFTVSDIIHVQGGIEVILRIFFHPLVRGKSDTSLGDGQQKIRMYCSKILHAICLAVESIAKTIGKHDDLILYLFAIMEDRKTFLPASTLLEELLAVNRKIVDLSTINNLQTLVSNLRDSSFPGFCRILSTAVADIDFSDERSTLLAQDKEEKDRSLEKSLADKNQGLLLNHPDFLSRMVKLASKAFPVGSLTNQIPHGFQRLVIDSTPLSLEDFEELFSFDYQNQQSSSRNSLGLFTADSSTGSGPNNASESAMDQSGLPSIPTPTRVLLPLSVQVMNEVMHKVEILYVLTLFLCGKYKFEVQSKLSELKFIPTLCDMFDKLGWGNGTEKIPHHNHHESGDCDCTPESALKIQFLRFVHSYCDHNDRRYLLLTLNEIQEIKQVCDAYGYEKPPTLSKTKYRCHGYKGLITKIIDELKKTSADNALRFWLSRAIEGFLRGVVSPPDQHFLINRGLVKHLFDHIVNSETRAKEIIQSSFDLLGEVMKFNAAGFLEFNKAVENEAQFDVFVSVMTSNVVDSNMFIRCSVLSHEKFLTSRSYNLGICQLCKFIGKWEHRVYLMYKLITSVSVESLTQENVSCLNTTLIFLMFAYNHGQLDLYLQAFVSEEEAQDHPGLILSNLQELLFFWKSHYLRRGKDCSQLEQSSSITFEKWQKVVDIMLSEDITKSTSILYYLAPKYRNTMKFRTKDYLTRDV